MGIAHYEYSYSGASRGGDSYRIFFDPASRQGWIGGWLYYPRDSVPQFDEIFCFRCLRITRFSFADRAVCTCEWSASFPVPLPILDPL